MKLYKLATKRERSENELDVNEAIYKIELAYKAFKQVIGGFQRGPNGEAD